MEQLAKRTGSDARYLKAGEARRRTVVRDGGFSRFRRAAQTPFNLPARRSGAGQRHFLAS